MPTQFEPGDIVRGHRTGNVYEVLEKRCGNIYIVRRQLYDGEIMVTSEVPGANLELVEKKKTKNQVTIE